VVAASGRSWEAAMVRLALAFAYDRAVPYERGFALAEEARHAFEELGGHMGAASSAVTAALAAIGRDLSTAAALTAERRSPPSRLRSIGVLSVADAASASWLVADAKARLAQVRAAAADAEGAESLYRDVVV
jgi:hypothetical protein